MKRDMTGGAVVLAVMAALAAVRVPGAGHRPDRRGRERHRRQRPATRRRGAPLRRPHQRGDQHRCRGQAGDGRRAGLRRRPARPGGGRRRGDPDRRDEGGARPAGRWVLRQSRRARLGHRAGRGGGRRAAVAVPARRRLRGASSPPPWPTPTTRRAGRGRSPPPCSSSTSSATCPGPTSTSPRSATRPTDSYEWTAGPTGFGARALLAWLGSDDPLAGVAMKGLTVRWSLAEAPDGIEEELATYVAETSHARFTGMAGLRFKTWRMRPGEWFEGCYVFATDEARAGVPGRVRRDRRRVAGVEAGRERADPDRGVRDRGGRRGLGRVRPRRPRRI